VLIVGGGDSALEAALAIAEGGAGGVSISYRGDAFSRAKAKNRERIEACAASGRVRLYLSSTVTRITRGEVHLEQQGRPVEIANDAVIVNAGGILPTGFLRQVGIAVDTRYGTA
jgi:thioredoxin reductase